MLLLFQSFLQTKQQEEALRQLNAAQPIIIDEKSGNFKFQSGSAAISTSFRQYLSEQVAPEIPDATQNQDIAFIQVIGHTDGQPNNRASNLD